MTQCFISTSNDPHLNLAFEHYLFSNVKSNDRILYLWRNSQTVVIGKFQNPWSECNVEKMAEDDIKLMRRYSGGGAVFQDLGNLCFTLISGSDYDVEEQKSKNNDFIISALNKFNITALASGRNDILVNERKISGAAFQIQQGNLMHHGTLLVNSDLDRLQLYLKPSKDKLETKGIKSVRSRVANLQEFNHLLTVEALIEQLRITYTEYFSDFDSIGYIDERILNSKSELKLEYENLISWDWLYGKTPAFTDAYKKRFSWGEIELLLTVYSGIIKDVVAFSDTLDNQLVDVIKDTLNGITFNNKVIVKQIKQRVAVMGCSDTQSHLLDIISLFE
ncbi:MAG: lipoate--protein ligase [Treponema sp.]|nr:lipoate--protein ligase [Treponema sp.]